MSEAGLTRLTDPLPRTSNQPLTGGAGEQLKGLQQRQLDGRLVLQGGHGEQQRGGQGAALQQLQPVARRRRLQP